MRKQAFVNQISCNYYTAMLNFWREDYKMCKDYKREFHEYDDDEIDKDIDGWGLR